MLVENLRYRVNWRAFTRGTSFLIPCLDPDKAKATVLVTTKRLKMQVLTKVVIKEGIQCLQVWRL
jgi:hypothetical protein